MTTAPKQPPAVDAGLVSVVVPFSARSPRRLERLLSALRRQEYAGCYETIIADDGSPEPSALEQMCRSFGAAYVRSPRDPACPDVSCRSRARNVGAAAARGKFILFLDQDILLTPGHIQNCVNIVSRHGVHTVCHCPRGDILELLLADDHRDRFSRFHLTLQKAMTLLEHVNVEEPLPVAAGEMWERVITHNLFLSREMWEKAGLFDEEYVGYGMEDSDYAFRLHEAGAFFPHLIKLRVYHIGHTRPDCRTAEAHARNVLRFFARHPVLLEDGESQLYEWAKFTVAQMGGVGAHQVVQST